MPAGAATSIGPKGFIISSSSCSGAHVNSAGRPLLAVRLDIWLDVACLFKTRSEAQTACKTGKVSVNGEASKPHRAIRANDTIEIGRSFGRKQRLVVKGVTERNIARTDARALYEDLTPAPTAEEIEMRRAERLYRAAITPLRSPDKRDRRALRKMKEGR